MEQQPTFPPFATTPTPPNIEEFIVVPDAILDQYGRGGIAILTCTGTMPNMEGNYDAVIESDLLKRYSILYPA